MGSSSSVAGPLDGAFAVDVDDGVAHPADGVHDGRAADVPVPGWFTGPGLVVRARCFGGGDDAHGRDDKPGRGDQVPSHVASRLGPGAVHWLGQGSWRKSMPSDVFSIRSRRQRPWMPTRSSCFPHVVLGVEWINRAGRAGRDDRRGCTGGTAIVEKGPSVYKKRDAQPRSARGEPNHGHGAPTAAGSLTRR